MALSLTNRFLFLGKPCPSPHFPLRVVGNYLPVITCRKKDILSYTRSSTRTPRCTGHSFCLGNRSALLVDADQVEKFRKKYGELSEIMEARRSR
ncbi:hypothetical protein I3760_08G061000 [Carya illinoinensis]|nr:hypothetical protein I3760_08G061000 [Carya illinoinensis]